MRASADHHDEDAPKKASAETGETKITKTNIEIIAGRFWARIWDLDCILELHLNDAGGMQGSFSADGEALEITGDSPGPDGEVRGLIRSSNLQEMFAAFRARLDADGLFLEVDVTDVETGLETAGHVMFARLG
jgi:hypothetical protein